MFRRLHPYLIRWFGNGLFLVRLLRMLLFTAAVYLFVFLAVCILSGLVYLGFWLFGGETEATSISEFFLLNLELSLPFLKGLLFVGFFSLVVNFAMQKLGIRLSEIRQLPRPKLVRLLVICLLLLAFMGCVVWLGTYYVTGVRLTYFKLVLFLWKKVKLLLIALVLVLARLFARQKAKEAREEAAVVPESLPPAAN